MRGTNWEQPKRGTVLFIALAALLLSGSGARANAADALTKGVLAAAAADFATTHWAFSSMSDARDANPMVRGSGTALAVKAAATAGVVLLDRELTKRGKTRAAKVVKIAAIVTWGSAAAWNMHQIRSARKR